MERQELIRLVMAMVGDDWIGHIELYKSFYFFVGFHEFQNLLRDLTLIGLLNQRFNGDLVAVCKNRRPN